MSVNKAYVERLALDVEKPLDAVLSYFSKPYGDVSEAERCAVRYNIIVIAEAIVALALHTARRLYREEPEAPYMRSVCLRTGA
ncbi:MAG: hypothetical protein N3H31_04960 [Candidatus Nezhaarchaeota archaeon]|nr:hypothetical protein [Candidatus Nezhaarchaeota archaeon]